MVNGARKISAKIEIRVMEITVRYCVGTFKTANNSDAMKKLTVKLKSVNKMVIIDLPLLRL